MKKRLFSLIIMCFLAISICLTGCGKEGLKDNPATEATVFSNGGMSVIKGDYLYFVNGYVDETTLTKDDNKEGKVTKSAIYRTKLKNNEIDKDDDGFLINAECVVSKVVGFSNGGFTIIDDNIYYATPYMKFSSDGQLQNNRVEFHRINIDGTKDEVIYTTSQNETQLNWSLYKIENTTYLVVYESSKIVSINALNGKKVGSVEGSTSYAILNEDDYVYNADRTGFNYNNIIYTRDATEADATHSHGNVVCAFNIATGKTEVLEVSLDRTYTIQNVTGDAVYYTYTSTAEPIACLHKRVLENAWNKTEEVKLSNMAYDKYYFVDYGNDIIIAAAEEAMWKLEGGADNIPTKLMASTRDVVGIYGDYAYYVSDSKLIRFNIHTGETQDAYGDKATLITNSNFIDFDNRRIYVYGQYTAENGDTNYYLTYFNEDFVEGELEQRFVGVFEKGDLPAVPEQPTEPEFEGDEIEKIPHID